MAEFVYLRRLIEVAGDSPEPAVASGIVADAILDELKGRGQRPPGLTLDEAYRLARRAGVGAAGETMVDRVARALRDKTGAAA